MGRRQLLMALDKVVDSAVLDAGMVTVADAIRAKAGITNQLVWPEGFKAAVDGIQTGGSSTSGAPGDITFYDYDGTIITSWTLEELATKTALPDYPSHEGLTCQGWNWSLADLKTTNRKMNVGAMYITDDGKTRIYIRLEEGRTSPMLGCCPNGTVTVDWGDGTEPDTLTGTSVSTVKWTPTHEYSAAGDYVIKLSVVGSVGLAGNGSLNQYSYLLRYSSSADTRNQVYQNTIQKVEIGGGVTSIGIFTFFRCYSLSLITIPNSVTSIGINAFQNCYSLSSITIPNSVTSIGSSAFYYCYSLSSITMPNGVTSIGSNAFRFCYSLSSITIPNSVTSIDNNAFNSCYSLSSITIPNSVTSIGIYTFFYCYSLSSITMSNGVTSIGSNAFNNCYSLSSITIPNSVTSIDNNVFQNCYGVRYYDFTRHTTVPTLSNTNAFTNISADCEIRVPAALADEWKAATNWSTYADHIVGV